MDAKAAASFEANKPAAADASAEGGVTEREKDAADVTLEAAAEADTAGEEGGGLRLSQVYVDFVLSWKPEVHDDPDELYARLINNPTFSRDEVERSTKLQWELVEQSKDCAASVESFHAWVRSKYQAKRYVEVDDDYIAQGILLCIIWRRMNYLPWLLDPWRVSTQGTTVLRRAVSLRDAEIWLLGICISLDGLSGHAQRSRQLSAT